MVTAKKTPSTLPPATDTGMVAASKPVAAKKVPVRAAKTVAPLASAPQVNAPAAKKAAAKANPDPVAATGTTISPEQRLHYVEVAAFYIAERRGFTPGHPVDDWSAAEAEVDRLIASGHFAL